MNELADELRAERSANARRALTDAERRCLRALSRLASVLTRTALTLADEHLQEVERHA